MNRAIKAVIVLLLLLTATLCVLIGLLHTQYATSLVNSLLSSYSQRLASQHTSTQHSSSSILIPTHIKKVTYEFPTHFTLHDVSFDKTDLSYIDQVDIWLNSRLIKKGKLAIDSVLIDGLSLQQGINATHPPENVLVSQLAINNLDYSDGHFSARGMNIQIEKPLWSHANQIMPFGKVQLSADQVYWQGEAFNQLLISSNYKQAHSTIYGLSFEWRDAQISGQAEQINDRWSLINVTLNKLNLNQKQVERILAKPWGNIAPVNWDLNSVDILNSDLAFNDIHLINVDASIEDLTFPTNIWQQESGYLSLNAESIVYQGEQWIEPSFQANFFPNSIKISNFNASLLQGFVAFNGQFSPHSAKLKNLSINGVKWIAEQENSTHWLGKIFHDYQSLSIEQLNIERSQFIQLATEPFWQLSGMSAEGKSLELIRKGRQGIWNGSLTMSANSASYQNIVASQGLFEMESQHGDWRLNRLFFPLQQGYIEASATMAFSKPSQPWQLEIGVDGLDIQPLVKPLKLPFELHGLAEFELTASGLAGDELMFAHSLTGQLQGSIRNAAITKPPQQHIAPKPLPTQASQLQPQTQEELKEVLKENETITPSAEFMTQNEEEVSVPVEISDIQIQMDRGRINVNKITIIGSDIDGKVEGQYDLALPNKEKVTLEYQQACQKHTGALTSDISQAEDQCLTDNTNHSK